MWSWVDPKSLPWWGALGPIIAGILQLYNVSVPNSLGLFGAILSAGLEGTPPFALIYVGIMLLWIHRKYIHV